MIIKLFISFALWKLSLQSQLILINEPNDNIMKSNRTKAKNANTSSRQQKPSSNRPRIPNKNETTNPNEIMIRRNENESENEANFN